MNQLWQGDTAKPFRATIDEPASRVQIEPDASCNHCQPYEDCYERGWSEGYTTGLRWKRSIVAIAIGMLALAVAIVAMTQQRLPVEAAGKGVAPTIERGH